MELEALEPLVGTWTTEVRMPGQEEVVAGRTTFEWLEGGGYLIERATMEDTRFPRGVMVIGPAQGRGPIVQHYFDSRGIARVYEISLEAGVLRLWRDDPEDFSQRYEGRLSDDGAAIVGAWEMCEDGATWRHDFDLTYRRA
jgi:hypothetical protein